MNTTHAERPSGSHYSRFAVAMLVALLCYPLSIGPAVAVLLLLDRYAPDAAATFHGFLNVFYHPLSLVTRSSDVVNEIVLAYVTFWAQLVGGW